MIKLHAAIGAVGIGTIMALPAFSAEKQSILCSPNTCSLNAFYLATGRGDPLECLDGSFLLEISVESDVLIMNSVGSVKRERVLFGELPLQSADQSGGSFRAFHQSPEKMVVATLDVYDSWSSGEFSLVETDLSPWGTTTVIAGICEEEG